MITDINTTIELFLTFLFGVFCQMFGIPMGANCASLIADLVLNMQ